MNSAELNRQTPQGGAGKQDEQATHATKDRDSEVVIRQAVASDGDQIRDIFFATYGKDYVYPQYYDIEQLMRLVYDDGSILLVAEESATGRILGTASVILDYGAYADLLGEFGRLAVHPDARGHGVGRLLMEGRLQRVHDRLHVGLSEPRVVHPFSQRISVKQGFAPVGFLPLALKFRQRESVAVCARYFGGALELRRNHPRVIPEAHALSSLAMDNARLHCDAIVDDDSAPYPLLETYDLEELSTEGYSSLMRIQRGRVQKREIFGPLRLHYGMFKLHAKHSTYLVASRGGRIVGAVGFTLDNVENNVRIFEVISLGEGPIRFLLETLERRCRETWGVEYVEVDVSAYAPRMQRTLLELGFLPAAYIPAMVFHEVERQDAIRMVRLLAAPVFQHELIPEVEPIAALVTETFINCYSLPRVAAAAPQIRLFAGLNQEQSQRLASSCRLQRFAPQQLVFRKGAVDKRILMVLSGRIRVGGGKGQQPLGEIGPRESLGELSLLFGEPHSASTTAVTAVEAASLSHEDFQRLIRQRPDIGVVLYHNMAAGLADKLRTTGDRIQRRPD